MEPPRCGGRTSLTLVIGPLSHRIRGFVTWVAETRMHRRFVHLLKDDSATRSTSSRRSRDSSEQITTEVSPRSTAKQPDGIVYAEAWDVGAKARLPEPVVTTIPLTLVRARVGAIVDHAVKVVVEPVVRQLALFGDVARTEPVVTAVIKPIWSPIALARVGAGPTGVSFAQTIETTVGAGEVVEPGAARRSEAGAPQRSTPAARRPITPPRRGHERARGVPSAAVNCSPCRVTVTSWACPRVSSVCRSQRALISQLQLVAPGQADLMPVPCASERHTRVTDLWAAGVQYAVLTSS